MAAKIVFFANEAIFSCKAAYLIDFDLLRTKICVINQFGEQFPVKKRLKWKTQNSHQNQNLILDKLDVGRPIQACSSIIHSATVRMSVLFSSLDYRH